MGLKVTECELGFTRASKAPDGDDARRFRSASIDCRMQLQTKLLEEGRALNEGRDRLQADMRIRPVEVDPTRRSKV